MLLHLIQLLRILGMFNKIHITLIVLLALLVHIGHIDGANPCNIRSYNNGSIVCVCNATYCDTIDKVTPLSSGRYLLYISSKDGLRFNKTSGTLITKIATNNVECKGARFKINTSKTYQKIKGFGGAFTDAAGINILSLSKGAQNNLLRSYYSKDGIEYNLGRVPIAGTDFSTHPYTYDDDGGPDQVLTNFNLTKEDINLKIPIIIRAQQMSEKEIQLVGSAWSAPIYMKTNKKITGLGFLDKIYYSAWADYHIKFLDEYKKYNISFWALTTGNEPINGIIPFATFNSMGWTSWTHREWIGQNLGPKLRDSQHNKTIIIGFDDQLILLPWWMKLVFQDTKAANYVTGIGIHWYMDIVTPISVLESTHNEFPDKFLVYTESCTGFLPWSRGVLLGSWERGEEYMHSIISTINHWVTSWIDWNIVLNLQGGPNWVENFVDSPIIVNNLTDEFYKQPLFYALGHFSKFIKQGALRIDIQPQQSLNVEVLAVQNPDKEVVIVFHNMGKETDVVLEDLNNNTCIEIKLPRKSFATLIFWP